MDKKASLMETLPRIMIIFIVVVLVLVGGGRLIWDAGRAVLGTFGLINITEVDYSYLNKIAQSNLNVLVNDINACKKSKDINCICSISLEDFYNTHRLDITNSEISLINIKDGNKITMQREKLEDFNCYYTKDSVQTENPLIINFDESPYIEKGFLSSNIKFNKVPPVYKSSKTCLVSTDFDPTKINKVCSLE